MLQSPAERHGERLAWLNASWSSIDLHLTHSIRELVRKDTHLSFDLIVIDYVETASGQRLLKEKCLNTVTGREHSLTVHSFDGVRGADSFKRLDGDRHQQVVIHRHFDQEDKNSETSRPMPLIYQWAGRQPLHVAIRKAKYLGEFIVEGKPCDAFLFAKVGYTGGQDRVHYLDKKTSLPLEVVAYLNPQEREKEHPLTVWKANEIREVQGYPFVWSASEEDYTGEGWALSYRREFRVESVVFNRTHARSEFLPEIHPDAVVFDTIAKNVVHPPARQGAGTATAEHAATSEAPIRAEPDRPWSDLAAPFSTVAGAALLIASLLLWRRRS